MDLERHFVVLLPRNQTGYPLATIPQLKMALHEFPISLNQGSPNARPHSGISPACATFCTNSLSENLKCETQIKAALSREEPCTTPERSAPCGHTIRKHRRNSRKSKLHLDHSHKTEI
ncbi:unnamed protein product [Ixodes persulcatus]